jgi:hypothetical protein
MNQILKYQAVVLNQPSLPSEVVVTSGILHCKPTLVNMILGNGILALLPGILAGIESQIS